MADERFDEEAVFKAAFKIASPEQREAYLKQAVGGDAALLERLHTLLSVYDHEGAFLESPPPGVAGAIAAFPSSEQAGDLIGRYRLLEEIGEGGMGVVYRAEQQEPIRRQVALKILKAGMDTRRIIARFETERQTLALMDHPNIVRVLDAGTTGERIKDEGGRMKDEWAATTDVDSSLILHPSAFILPLVRTS